MAGHWFEFVSVPVFQFILLRWYIRILIWFCFLLRVSRLKLHLLPAHPDRVGGLGFPGKSTIAFAPLLFAQGALLSGQIASRIFYNGQSLLAFKLTILGFCYPPGCRGSGSAVLVHTTACKGPARRLGGIWRLGVFVCHGF